MEEPTGDTDADEDLGDGGASSRGIARPCVAAKAGERGSLDADKLLAEERSSKTVRIGYINAHIGNEIDLELATNEEVQLDTYYSSKLDELHSDLLDKATQVEL